MADPKITGVNWDLVNEDAATWAREYGGRLVKDIDSTTRRNVGNAVGKFYSEGQTMGQLNSSLGTIYSPQRAERIAITEVTRAAAEGEREIAKELAKDGIMMVEVWQTRNDSVVCDICRPRNGVEEGKGQGDKYWDRNLGPPAHPNCRCNIRHEFEKPKEGAIEEYISGEPPVFSTLDDARVWAKKNGMPIYSDVDDMIELRWQALSDKDKAGITREKFISNWRRNLTKADDEYLLEGYNSYARAIHNKTIGSDINIIFRKPTAFNSFESDFVVGYYLEEEKQIVMLQDKIGLWKTKAQPFIPKRYRSNADESYEGLEGTLVHEYGHHASLGKSNDIARASTNWFAENSISDSEDWIKNNISSYATENVKELTAESYALYSHPDYLSLQPNVRSFISTIIGIFK